MREATGSTWLIGLVMLFILIFASYLALTVNYQKAFTVKNDVLSIIEKREGFTDMVNSDPTKWGGAQTVNNYLMGAGYKETGKCPIDWYGVSSLTNNSTIVNTSSFEKITKDNQNNKYYYCVKKELQPNRCYSAYYKVMLFFRFNLPILGDIITYDVDGETNIIRFPGDILHQNKCKTCKVDVFPDVRPSSSKCGY